MSFVHLHTHTQYSLLDGANKISEYIKAVKALGMNSAAITDHGVMYGMIDFYKEAQQNGIKPILGCEVYLAKDDDHLSRTPGTYHLILLAENNEGYENLTRLVSLGFIEGYYYKPRVDKTLLRKYSKGLIALSACLKGEIACKILKGGYEAALNAALEYADIFGKDSFFLELQNHGIEAQQTVNQALVAISKETGLKLVATNDIHYTYRDDYLAHDILLCIQTGKRLQDTDRMRYAPAQFYVRSEEEMRTLFPYAAAAIENTQKIADRCNVEIKFHETKLPEYDLGSYEGGAADYLRELCLEGLYHRYGYRENVDDLLERMEFELQTIEDMGFVDYFLIVWDFIRYAKEHNIMVGPGRGSAAGSIVAYALRITDVDPISHGLVFERFLNPHRVSMPDIDIDFCYERRGEVIDYVVKKYGSDKVMQIITFGTMAARAAIRDVGRVMDLPYSMVDKIAKLIPQELNMTIDRAMDMNPKLKEAIAADSRTASLIEMSRKLEGMPRHASTHAAGVVICKSPAYEIVPLSMTTDGIVTTQFTMTTIEELGLLKMDFLGLRTLTVIQRAVELAGITEAETDTQLPEVYRMIASGNTDGVFQLESAGMRAFMQGLQPSCFEDIVAGISLYRPGPMDFIPQYIRGKKNPEQVRYHCDELIDILKPTYGCIVYQEQVMQIVQRLAGYSLGRSDILRRAMSKKKSDVMNRERQTFVYGDEKEGITGCIGNGISEAVANTIFDEMIDFAKYAFNKSHSVAYAVIAYRTAYLKCLYKVEFMASLLTSVIDFPPKIIAYLYACRQMDIKVIAPDINRSGKGFEVSGDSIAFALNSIKSVGGNVAEAIRNERLQNGNYTDFYDFLVRTRDKGVNKKAIENMIKAGAFDELSVNRHSLLEGYEDALEYAIKEQKDRLQGQTSIFDLMSDDGHRDKGRYQIKLYEELSVDELLAQEREVLGIYLSGHPLDGYEAALKVNATAMAVDFEYIPDEERPLKDRQSVTVGALITGVKKIFTSKNTQMAYIELEDLTGSFEAVVFPNTLAKYDNLIYEDTKLLIKGEVSIDNESKPAKLIVKSCYPLEELPRQLYVAFRDKSDYEENEAKLIKLISESHGHDELIIFLRTPRAVKKISGSIDASEETGMFVRLKELFGEDRVKSVYKKLAKNE